MGAKVWGLEPIYEENEMAKVESEIEIRIPDDQMKVFNDLVTRIENSKVGGKKSLVGHVKSFIFGRLALFGMFAAYIAFQNGGLPEWSSINRQVLNFDKTANILTVEGQSGELINYILKDQKLFNGREEVSDDWLDNIKNLILVGETEGFKPEKKWLGIF